MSKKYDVSILAVFKNEESFMSEWIDHYFSRNIDHIYLLNDGSTDNSIDIIHQHVNKNSITLLHTSQADIEYQETWRQKYLYNKYYSYILQETQWVGIFDLDEFCYSPNEVNFKSILKDYDNSHTVQQLVVDWYWFGSNGFVDQPKNIINSFVKRGLELSKVISEKTPQIKKLYPPNWCCKSFAKTNYIENLCHHYNIFFNMLQKDYCFLPDFEFNKNISDDGSAYINHYVGSSNYYFNNKVARGSCNKALDITNNKKIIYEYINLNEVEDIRLKNQNINV